MNVNLIEMDDRQLDRMGRILSAIEFPEENESITHNFKLTLNDIELANGYFAIVAICHQTSPIGENRLCGHINGQTRFGWDYLKEKFLLEAVNRPELCRPDYWASITPLELALLFADDISGRTLNRIAERTLLLNDLGRHLSSAGFNTVADAFAHHTARSGVEGFFEFLAESEAYSDPVRKKTLFFMSLALSECSWLLPDAQVLSSPVDYHEMRGHLRVGTLHITDGTLADKIDKALPVSVDDDVAIRLCIQSANEKLARRAQIKCTTLHYLLWNIFRSCCDRDPESCHCNGCPETCTLPHSYAALVESDHGCLFSSICMVAGREHKISEPAYTGHYY